MAPKNRADRPVGPAPTRESLHQVALAHLARYGTTEAGLARVLGRRIDRWARTARDADPADAEAVDQASGVARSAIREIVRQLAQTGALDDAAFAASRARKLNRAGRSRRAVTAHLAARGVSAETVRAAVPDGPEQELAAAVAMARRRRIGPFRAAEPVEGAAAKELGMLARAGFSRDVAERALRMDADEAEALVLLLRQS